MAIKKVKGVAKVEVSLNRGVADITFRPGNTATVEDVRRVAIDSGFTPKAAEVRIAGTVIHREKPALAVTGLDVVYLLVDHPSAKGLARRLHDHYDGKDVVVSGIVPESAKGGEPRVLQVQEFALRKR
ncbi:MAG: heavy-metal-associated domain-containing protein [Thermoanaerobaculia bacterium]